jgi:hypothetical protein
MERDVLRGQLNGSDLMERMSTEQVGSIALFERLRLTVKWFSESDKIDVHISVAMTSQQNTRSEADSGVWWIENWEGN